jgi:type IV pilus secretin PilQ/predicted competence protein
MKYIIDTHCIYIFLLVFALGCSSKKDIITEQPPPITSEEIGADNATVSQPGLQEGMKIKINDIRLSESRDGSDVIINATKKPNYTHFKLSRPDRIILDIPDIANDEPIKEFSPESGMVSTIRTSLMSDKELNYLRVEIVLKSLVTYTVQSNDSTIVVNIKKSQLKQNEGTDQKSASTANALLLDAQNANVGDGNLIKLQLQNSIPRFTSYKLLNPARLVVELDNARNKIMSGVVNINENNLKKIRIGQRDTTLKIVFDIKGNSVPEYEIRQSHPFLIVALGPDAIEAGKKSAALPATDTAEQAADSPGTEKTAPDAKTPAIGEPMYTGEKISLDFKDADLKNVLRLLGDIGGINMTIGDKVAGKVTLKLENIPCDEALDIVLINNGLDKTVTPQYTRIDLVEQIKKFNDDRSQAKRSHEQAEDTIIKTFPISYAQASNLSSFIKAMNVLTPNRGSVNFFELTNKLTVSDIPSVVAKVAKIIDEQDIPTRQVMIESRVVQSAPSFVRDLGIAWGGTYNGHGGNAAIPISGAAGGTTNVVNLLGAANGAFNIGYIVADKYALDATLTAAENEDKLKILSNPRLMTLDNKEASIKQGVQLPYLKLNENGVTSTEFKDAVLEMKVKPKITAANTIAINVDVKKDQKSAQTGAGNEPGIDVRQITTDLLVESGKTVVIGGIYETTKAKNIKKVPFFGDLPLLGWAFRSVREEDTLTEMLVFITVTIVESPQKITIDSKENKG